MKRVFLTGIGVLWFTLIAIGTWYLWRYENTPGTAAQAPVQWPADSRLSRSAALPTLVMLAHPRCPCTRASMGELARIMAQCQGRVNAYVLFLSPDGFPTDWTQTDLWRSASVIPGVTVVYDPNGSEARRFHAATSGQTLLYDTRGHLLFSGGITEGRGHSGDNAGQTAIVSLLTRGTADTPASAVFGCPLFNETTSKRGGNPTCKP